MLSTPRGSYKCIICTTFSLPRCGNRAADTDVLSSPAAGLRPAVAPEPCVLASPSWGAGFAETVTHTSLQIKHNICLADELSNSH